MQALRPNDQSNRRSPATLTYRSIAVSASLAVLIPVALGAPIVALSVTGLFLLFAALKRRTE